MLQPAGKVQRPDNDPFMLTPHQQAALRLDSHLSVTANAGSGKTRVLVDRYCAIVSSGGAGVGEVVALTYTEKAAGELRRKIAERIAEILSESTDPRKIARLEEVREQLPAAFIGTIHSFCARILREFPVEAGVDAAFTVLEGLDQSLLLNEAIRGTFGEILRSEEEGPEKGALLDAVRIIGRSQVVDAVRLLVEQRARLEQLTASGIYSLPDEEILSLWSRAANEWIEGVCATPRVERALRSVCGSLKDPRGAELLSQLDAVGNDGPARARVIAGALQEILTGSRTVRKALLRKEPGPGFAEAELEVGTAFETIHTLVPALLGEEGPPPAELLSISRSLLRTAVRSLGRYEAKKRENGRLDFEDLLLSARALFDRPAVRDALSRRFRFVMIDEYQDTNDLQYALLRPLLNDLKTGNLFIVGDPKQSIYRFRNADVAVFDRTCRDLEAHGGSRVNLGESFRPLRDVAAFVNLIFAPLLDPGEQKADFEVGYDPLVRARGNAEPGRVEILLGTPEDPATPEPLLIAHGILDLIRRGVPVFDRNESPRPVRPGDIAILLRSRTRLPELELALANTGIPYVVSGGVGFYETQDTLDFYNYLRFLDDPADDVALTGILRSPFFTVSDVQLFEAAVRGRRGSFWSDLRHQKERRELPESFARAVASLEEDLELCRRLPVTEIISRIVGMRLYRAVLAGTGRGAQAEANLRKLQELAAAFEVPGFTTLFDFTRRLRQQIDAKEKEGQGAIAAGGNVVQIMTVHAAKGLEFPVVVVPSLDRPFRYDPPPFLNDRLGLAFSRRSADGRAENYPLTNLLSLKDRPQTVAEEKRIFYVACTRARDVLVLSGAKSPRSGGTSWRTWMLDILSPGVEPSPGPLIFSVRTATLLQRGESFESGMEEHPLTVHVVRPEPAISSFPGVGIPAAQEVVPPLHPEVIEGRGKGEVFSATKIKTFRECPARYFYQYRLGLPQEHGWSGRDDESETADREFPAELRGRVFHSVMEEIERHPQNEESLRSQIRKSLMRETFLNEENARDLSESLLSMIRGVVGSAFWEEVSRGTGTRSEFTISSVLRDDYLTGTMDRIYRDSSGEWHVLDFKTDRVDATSVDQRAESYWPQLEFYALLLCRFYDLDAVSAEILFTALPDRPMRRRYSREDLGRAEERIGEVVEEIREGVITPVNPPCAGCPFADACAWKNGGVGFHTSSRG